MKFAVLSALLACIFYACTSDKGTSVEDDTTSGSMKLVPAEDSSFQMGQSNPDIGGVGFSVKEQPVHTVSFTHDFWMDSTEVTQLDYRTLMSEAYGQNFIAPTWQATFGQGDDYPVYNIYWDDAALFCNARSIRDGYDTVYSYTGITGFPGNGCALQGLAVDVTKNGYRMPTEAEWEYACRAGSGTDYYWGKDHPYPANSTDTSDFNGHAIWKVNSYNLTSTNAGYGTHPVATKSPNAFGLYDMSGNLYEFCHDWDGGMYTSEAQVDPAGPATGNYRMVRGGSWGNEASYLRSSNRSFAAPDYEYYFIGFRTVRTAE
ncbi:formylglycine-generating enzyme family protein [Fibrobacterota bacterium]